MSEVKISHGGKIETYSEFVEKFKPKRTTDDCMTPPPVYDVISNYVTTRYNIESTKFVRPFWPGKDYQSFEYPNGCVVVDNPPFSILAKIKEYYKQNNILFFLFAPELTAFNKGLFDYTTIFVDSAIVYENGARVKTCFITNLEDDYLLRCDAALGSALRDANRERPRKKRIQRVYDKHVLSPAFVGSLVGKCEFAVRKNEAVLYRQLESQKPFKTSIYGGGLLVNDAVADKVDKFRHKDSSNAVWDLSDNELKIIDTLNRDDSNV